MYINRERSSTQYIIKMLKSPHTAPVILEILVTCAVLSSSSESHPSSKMKSQSLYYSQFKHINTQAVNPVVNFAKSKLMYLERVI